MRRPAWRSRRRRRPWRWWRPGSREGAQLACAAAVDPWPPGATEALPSRIRGCHARRRCGGGVEVAVRAPLGAGEGAAELDPCGSEEGGAAE
ncbi:hypothetical protein U9M48_033725 [Paspalum notatum var. saurae]|uniref:Uncharacterized protein n=1 Tax=Paspalum notatum var. saurae TaxID=547442 RepID=A0AAQ3U8Z3_PASNO